MMALSIRQPWAWLIVNGHKDIENRDWHTGKRGPILIHAGKQLDREAHDDLRADIHPVTGERTRLGLLYPAMKVELGGIVGIAEITGCTNRSDSEWFVGRNGIMLRAARPLAFQPCPGKLGFFEPARTIDLREIGPTTQESLL